MQTDTRTVSVDGVSFGGRELAIVAGPCAIESRAQLLAAARSVAASGAAMLRGGIFKLRSDPRSFQGLEAEAYDIVRDARAETGLPIVSEITDPRQVAEMHGVVSMFQVGARNMHNYALLKELASAGKPVLLKRGMSATIEEWLLAAEYLAGHGNPDVVLCERGIRTFERATRNTLDLSAVAYVKRHSRLPVVVDPSHGTGIAELVPPMCMAAVAAGADGLLLEVHPHPELALSDARQALTLEGFARLVQDLRPLAAAMGRSLAEAASRGARAASAGPSGVASRSIETR